MRENQVDKAEKLIIKMLQNLVTESNVSGNQDAAFKYSKLLATAICMKNENQQKIKKMLASIFQA
jgi:hypothetical protein